MIWRQRYKQNALSFLNQKVGIALSMETILHVHCVGWCIPLKGRLQLYAFCNANHHGKWKQHVISPQLAWKQRAATHCNLPVFPKTDLKNHFNRGFDEMTSIVSLLLFQLLFVPIQSDIATLLAWLTLSSNFAFELMLESFMCWDCRPLPMHIVFRLLPLMDVLVLFCLVLLFRFLVFWCFRQLALVQLLVTFASERSIEIFWVRRRNFSWLFLQCTVLKFVNWRLRSLYRARLQIEKKCFLDEKNALFKRDNTTPIEQDESWTSKTYSQSGDEFM